MCDNVTDGATFEELALIEENAAIGPRLFKLTLAAPKAAAAIKPGQFVHLLLPGSDAHILRRPFSVYRAFDGKLEIIYQTVGQGTYYLAEVPAGTQCSIIAPLGHGWAFQGGKALVVGGGVGAAPLFMFTESLVSQGADVEVVLGAQTADALVTRADYAALLGREPHIATDDGSLGVKGFCTGPVEELLAAGGIDSVYCCGPTPLMHAVARACETHGVPCWVSMEKRMACGVGACLSCVVETTGGKRRSCVDGPVFNAKELVW